MLKRLCSLFRPKRRPVLVLRQGVVSWHVAIVAANGETLMHSEDYSSRGNAIRAAEHLAEELQLKVKA